MYNIVIADSNNNSAELMKSVLQNIDYSIWTTNTGASALSQIKFSSADILVCDSHFSDMSGYDLCRRVKNDPETRDCLILFVDSHPTAQSRLKSIEIGVDDYMEKAYDANIFIAKVKSLTRIKSLSNELKENYRELEEKNKLLEVQLEMSRYIQDSIIQKIDLKNDISIISRYEPSYIIGGDFFEFKELEDGKYFIFLADISGHGISSALLTTMLKRMVIPLEDYYTRPNDFLAILNSEFIDIFGDRIGTYISSLALLIDTRERSIKFSNAGLSSPIYIDTTNDMGEELFFPGTPIGMIENMNYNNKKLSYSKGDFLLFHTDGLSDTFYKNSPDKFLSEISKLLIHSKNTENIEDILDIIFQEFHIAQAKSTEKIYMDDATAILCRL